MWVPELDELRVVDLINVKDRVGVALHNAQLVNSCIAKWVFGAACSDKCALSLEGLHLLPEDIQVLSVFL